MSSNNIKALIAVWVLIIGVCTYPRIARTIQEANTYVKHR